MAVKEIRFLCLLNEPWAIKGALIMDKGTPSNTAIVNGRLIRQRKDRSDILKLRYCHFGDR